MISIHMVTIGIMVLMMMSFCLSTILSHSKDPDLKTGLKVNNTLTMFTLGYLVVTLANCLGYITMITETQDLVSKVLIGAGGVTLAAIAPSWWTTRYYAKKLEWSHLSTFAVAFGWTLALTITFGWFLFTLQNSGILNK